MGRPASEGGARSERIQLMTTEKLAQWIDGQSIAKESRSQTIHRLLLELKEKHDDPGEMCKDRY
jgi:hypothetical protein